MEYPNRKDPLFSPCGLNCGLCPRFYADGPSRCPGCGGVGFWANRPTCGALSCSRRRGLEYCFLCREYPCKKYEGADSKDSFISHLHQFKDAKMAKNLGIDAYHALLQEKIEALKTLLSDYNDGRHKSFYCLAVSLLELDDIKDIMAKLAADVPAETPPKERAKLAAGLFHETAAQRGITLKLRKREKEA